MKIHQDTQWIYQNDLNNSVRYVLGIKGKNPLICIGINPSIAEPDKLDNTLRSVKRISVLNNFDGWVMLNIYPQRSTDPEKIHIKCDNRIHDRNCMIIENLLKQSTQKSIWAAWGNNIENRPFLYQCLRDIYNITKVHQCNWIIFGKITKRGHPHHPLYLNSAVKPESFNMGLYINNFL